MTTPQPPSPTPILVHQATSFFSRLGGLLARPQLPPHEALWLDRCASVHTLFMRYAIDVAFLDRAGRVLKVVHDLRPWRAAFCLGAHSALELRAGRAAHLRIEAGAVIHLGETSSSPATVDPAQPDTHTCHATAHTVTKSVSTGS